MEQKLTQNIVLDSCVVIDLLEKPGLSHKIRAALKGKSVKIILCDIVLHEVARVRKHNPADVVTKVSNLIRRPVEVTVVSSDQIQNGQQVSRQYQTCHRGDNFILALCQAKSFVLVTFDKMLLLACNWEGVAAFHPSRIRGI